MATVGLAEEKTSPDDLVELMCYQINQVPLPADPEELEAALHQLSLATRQPVDTFLGVSKASGFTPSEHYTSASLLPAPFQVYVIGMVHGVDRTDEADRSMQHPATQKMLTAVGRLLGNLNTFSFFPYTTLVGVEWLQSGVQDARNGNKEWDNYVESVTGKVSIQGRADPDLIKRIQTATESDGETARDFIIIPDHPMVRGVGRQDQRDALVKLQYARRYVDVNIIPHITATVNSETYQRIVYVLGQGLLHPLAKTLTDRGIPYVSVFQPQA
jgi:hypothetical protein